MHFLLINNNNIYIERVDDEGDSDCDDVLWMEKMEVKGDRENQEAGRGAFAICCHLLC